MNTVYAEIFWNAQEIDTNLVWTTKALEESASWLTSYALSFVYFIALSFLLYEGFKILTASDDDGWKVEKAKKRILIILVSILIIFIANSIVVFFDSMFLWTNVSVTEDYDNPDFRPDNDDT